MRFAVRVEVTLRTGIADPEGATIERALPALGFGDVRAVRAGRSFRFELEAPDEAAARRRADELAHRLLANPVIEDSSGPCSPGDSRRTPPVSGRVGVVVFPGTNCEHDVFRALELLGGTAELVWHGPDGPGRTRRRRGPRGLRPRRLPAAGRPRPLLPGDGGGRGVRRRRWAGGGHLQRVPGAHRGRAAARGLAEEPAAAVPLHAGASHGGVRPFGADRRCPVGTELSIPINHFVGSYVCDQATLDALQDDDQIVLRYLDNPNGSVDDIAGICQRGRQRGRPDAPPRAGLRPPARFR